jgi:uncharacterized paraquat-inducible protein A
MTKCIVCRALNEQGAETCTRCGHELAKMTLSTGMKIAWAGFASAILAALILWTLTISGLVGIYPIGLLALVVGGISVLIGLASFRFNH